MFLCKCGVWWTRSAVSKPSIPPEKPTQTCPDCSRVWAAEVARRLAA